MSSIEPIYLIKGPEMSEIHHIGDGIVLFFILDISTPPQRYACLLGTFAVEKRTFGAH